MSKKRKIEMTESSGNIYADLGFADAEELHARFQIGFHVYKILKEKKLKQVEIAALLGIKQPEASHLMNGHFSRIKESAWTEIGFLTEALKAITLEAFKSALVLKPQLVRINILLSL